MNDILKAAGIIRNGGLVAFPTETVYGLGADAFNSEALAKIFEVKGRPRFDPLIIHIAAIETLENAANLPLLNKETRKKLFLLAENFWPGPLSIVLPKNEKIPGIATAGLATAAIRFPDHEIARELISLSTGAVAAPSANPFGSISPTRAEHVRDRLGDRIDMILDGGPARIGLESTVIDITGECIKILRPGGTPKEAIEQLIGPVKDGFITAAEGVSLVSPGQLKSHYAPRTPLLVLNQEDILKIPCETGSAFLFFDGFSRDSWQKLQNPPESAVIRVLSEAGQPLEAASRLFETLHELDNGRISRIFAQLAPPKGLGEAINDRLTRASA
ncbi:MAG: L-threonylcarbamoyladenylate synthase [Treponema sp.]|nr:L-threonylcarbamoyladenylate synthase [Treponema sp.]